MALNACVGQNNKSCTGVQLQTGCPTPHRPDGRWLDESWMSSTHYCQRSQDSYWLHPKADTYTSSLTLWTKLPLTAKHRHTAHTTDTWTRTQVSKSQAKFHSKGRWDDYQHRNHSLAHITSGKWAQLSIARTINHCRTFYSQHEETDAFRDKCS